MSNKQRPRCGTYLSDLVTIYRDGRLPLIPGTIGILDIWHEAPCPRPAGGKCTCHAELGDLTYPRIEPVTLDDGPDAA